MYYNGNGQRRLVMKTIKSWFLTHKYCLVLLYFIPYSLSYFLLGNFRTPVADIHCTLDDMIPFNEYFVIPYVLWYLYVAFAIVFLLFKDKKEFLQYCAFLFGGTTVCLIIFLIFPTSVAFRPEVTGTNFFTKVIAFLFAMDNPTNVCPSIHVYAALVTHIALVRSAFIKKSPWIHGGSLLFAFSVCLATVFLKQHSVLDGVAAAILCFVMYIVVYRVDWQTIFKNRADTKALAPKVKQPPVVNVKGASKLRKKPEI